VAETHGGILQGPGMAPGHPDSDDSLEVSEDSELSPGSPELHHLAAAKGLRQPEPDPDLSEYGRSLGANLEDPSHAWAVREAFHAALPASWAEFADDEGRVYFYNYTTNESTWNHPMDEVYRELIAFVTHVQRLRPSPSQERLHELIGQHLREVYDRASAQLASWTGPFRSEDGDCYYFNEASQQSTWVSPVEEWEYELSVRQTVLQRCLLSPTVSKDRMSSDVLEEGFVPLLKLPHPGDGPDSPRSFHTARESSRSQCSARSMASATGSEASPGRMRSRGRSALTVSSLKETGRLDSAPELTEPELTDPESADPELTKTVSSAVADRAAASPTHREDRAGSEELEITFGHTAAVSMPTRSQVNASLLPRTLEGDLPKDDQEATDSGPSTSAESQGLDAKIEEVNDAEAADEASTCAPAAAADIAGGDDNDQKDELEATVGSGPSTSAETQGLESKTDEDVTAEVKDELLDDMDLSVGCAADAETSDLREADPAGAQSKLSSENCREVGDAPLAPDQASVTSVGASLAKPVGGEETPAEDSDGMP